MLKLYATMFAINIIWSTCKILAVLFMLWLRICIFQVMAMAAELSEMKKKEGNKEADKLAQIVEHEKMARKIAAELVEAYASDRKCEFVVFAFYRLQLEV